MSLPIVKLNKEIYFLHNEINATVHYSMLVYIAVHYSTLVSYVNGDRTFFTVWYIGQSRIAVTA